MRSLRYLLMVPFFVGCTTLAGDWEGEMECDGIDQGFDMEVSLSKDGGKEYSGDGTIALTCSDGQYSVDCDLEFEMAVEAEKASGDQELDVELDDCNLDWDGGGEETDCGDDPDDVEWDGKDTIEWKGTLTFVGGETDCEVELERDGSGGDDDDDDDDDGEGGGGEDGPGEEG